MIRKLSFEELALIVGGNTPSPRECYIAGVGVVLTSSIVGVLAGWFKNNWDTFRSCFN
jgi:hypothetical protein